MRRQGSQFASTNLIRVPATREIRIGMDGRGAWRDKVFVESLWRPIKYEEVCLRACASVAETDIGTGRSLRRLLSRPVVLTDATRNRSLTPPDQARFNKPMPDTVAA